MPDQHATQPDGSVVYYDASGHAVRQTWPDGRLTTFQYRGDGYVATTGDEHVLYDGSGHEVKQWQGGDESTALSYHSLANGHYSLTDPKGVVSEYASDGHLLRQVSVGGAVTTFQYRGDGYVATTGDEHVLYDGSGHEVKQWQGGDESSALSYHSLANGHYSLTDPKGVVSEYASDGHVLRQVSAGGAVTTFQYRGDSYVATTGDEHVLYDANGHEVKQWQGGNESSAQAYRSLGNGHYTLTDPKGAVTEYGSDGHLVRQTVDGQVTTFHYRGDGYVATTGDQHVLYDGGGHEVKQWQGGDESTAQAYHSLANGHYSLTDPKGTATEYSSDGHLVRQSSPDGSVTTFHYRGDGYVATTGDEHVLYDGGGHEVKQWQGGDESQAQSYHSLGGGHYSLTDPKGTVTEYASGGHLVRQTAPGGEVTTFHYRADGYVATTGDEHVLYDGGGHEVKQWQGNDESQAQSYHSLANGHYSLTDPTGTVTEYADGGHLVQQTSPDHQVTTFQYRGDDYVATTGDQHVWYDGGGHEVKQWQGSDESQAQTYHSLGNGDYTLTDPKGVVTEYAPGGHLVEQVAGGQTTTFQYRGDDYVATTGDEHVLYDGSGHEVKQWEGGDESQAQTYHSLGNGDYTLTDPKGVVTEYQPDGHLVQQVTDGQTTTFQYRGDDYVATTGDEHVLYDGSGHEVKQWEGGDESQAQSYHSLGNGDYTLTDPKGTVTEYQPGGHLVEQVAGGQTTTFQYRGDDYVATTGDEHVLYDANGHEVKQWQGGDESSAERYHQLGNGDYTLTDPKGTVTEYQPGGHLVEQVAGGQTTTFQYRGDDYVATTGDEHVLYDHGGHEVKQWEGGDESQAQLYHPLGNGDYTLTDQKGTVTEYTANGHLVQQTSADHRVTTFQYRGDGYVATTGDQHVLYDGSGHEVKQWQGNDESQAESYHPLGNGGYSLTDPKGTVTEYGSDGHLVQQTSADGKVTTFQYRGDNYVATTGDEHVLYDANGHEVKQWEGDDESQAQTYHQLGNGGYSLTDPKGTVTEYGSDGHLVQQTSADGKVTTFQYRGDNYVATTGDEHVLYDANGHEVKQWEGDDESQAQTYHQLGNGGYSLTDPKGTVTEYGSDGHLVQQTSADGKVTTFQYRGDNYVATTGDEHVLYDANGHEVKQWQGDDESKALTYHGLGGGHYTLTDPKGTVTEYTPDGRLVRQTSPDGKITTFQYRGDNYVATTGDQHVLYDGDGNEVKQWQGNDESKALNYHGLGNGDYTLTDPKGTVTEYTPDGHLVRQTSPDGKITTFQYRGDNYVATTGDQHVLYDGDGNEIKQWQGNDESKAKIFHDLGNGHYTLTDPDGTVTEYDQNNHPILVTKPGQPPETIQWLSNGDYIVTQGDQHSRYNGDGTLLDTWTGGDESVSDHYTYLGNGDLVITGPDGTTEYGPDGMPITTTEPDGTKIVWKTDLAALHAAIATVRAERDSLEAELKTVGGVFDSIEADWKSPAGHSFTLLATDFKKAQRDLVNALDESVTRMQSSYQNYVDSETKNASIISQINKEGHKLAGQTGGGA